MEVINKKIFDNLDVGIGLVKLIDYIDYFNENKKGRNQISAFSSGRDISMEKILKYKCLESDNARLTRTYLVVTISKHGEFSASEHEIVGYFSLSSYYVFDRHNNSEDITLGPGDKVINTKVKWPALHIDYFSRNHNNLKNGYSLKGFGKVIFDLFIIQIVEEISSMIGIKLLTLFAADHGSTKLIEYYESLQFVKADYDSREDFHSVEFEPGTEDEHFIFMFLEVESIIK